MVTLEKSPFSRSISAKTIQSSSRGRATTLSSKSVSSKEFKPFYLFYFLSPQDMIITVLIDIIHRMRLQYTNKGTHKTPNFENPKTYIIYMFIFLVADSSFVLNNEIHDINSIVEQFHAALRLGPSIICIDGLSELEHKQQTIKLSHWLPTTIDTNSKFILTLRKSTECYSELTAYKTSITSELVVFKGEQDYQNYFAKLLEAGISGAGGLDQNNCLYNKSCGIYSLLKTANHASNPLFVQLIAKELFCFDHEIYRNHPMYSRKSTGSSLLSAESRTVMQQTENHVIDSYIEDVSTIREVIQKIILRYLVKRYNWSTNTTKPLCKGKKRMNLNFNISNFLRKQNFLLF